MNEPNPKNIVDCSGPPGESVFHKYYIWGFGKESSAEINSQILNTINHIAEMKDDRALVLVGAMIVESAVDGLIAAIMPGYKKLSDNRDVTFSVRIELARALRLCPSFLFNYADTIRGIRNDFAHNLLVDNFDELPQGRIQAMRTHASNVNPNYVLEETNAEVFKHLVTYLCSCLELYRSHVIQLNGFMRSEVFLSFLQLYCEAQGAGDRIEIFDQKGEMVAVSPSEAEAAKAVLEVLHNKLRGGITQHKNDE